MDFTGSISGVQDLDRTFANLPRAMQRKAYSQALRAGAGPVRDAAQENIRIVSQPFTGLAQKRGTIRIYNLRKSRGNFRVSVQVKRGLTNPAKKSKGGPVRVGLYLAVLEYGKAGQPPRSWIRKAIREKKGPAVDALTKEMSKRMIDAIKDARGSR
jgi:HK97 gp10 family phage protein